MAKVEVQIANIVATFLMRLFGAEVRLAVRTIITGLSSLFQINETL